MSPAWKAARFLLRAAAVVIREDVRLKFPSASPARVDLPSNVIPFPRPTSPALGEAGAPPSSEGAAPRPAPSKPPPHPSVLHADGAGASTFSLGVAVGALIVAGAATLGRRK